MNAHEAHEWTRKRNAGFLALPLSCLFVCFAGSSLADTHYVWTNSPTPTSPYTNWTRAARDIQSAIDAATAGDTVLVTNGVYWKGGLTGYSSFVYNPQNSSWVTNRVVINKALTVRSVNGPTVTTILGYRDNSTNIYAYLSDVRCVWMTNGASLMGFTLTNGSARGGCLGGGVFGYGRGAVVSNCIMIGNASSGGGAVGGNTNEPMLAVDCTIVGNSGGSWGGGAMAVNLARCVISSNEASTAGGGVHTSWASNCLITCNRSGWGGGAYFSTLHNCFFTRNSASSYGGGASYCTSRNCTFAGNSAEISEGGVHDSEGAGRSASYNCIIYFNTAGADPNYAYGAFTNCCLTPLPAGGTGNFTNDPQLASASHLSSNSICLGKGSDLFASGTDLDGEPWNSPPAVGCDEFYAGAATGLLTVAASADYTNVAAGFAAHLTADIGGWPTASRWDFGDGTVMDNEPYAEHAWATQGTYTVTLTAYNETYSEGVGTTLAVHVASAPTHYVARGNAAPLTPYTNWAMAATNIQPAIDVAVAGALVLVSNGVYDTGGVAGYPVGSLLTNRVAIYKPLTVRSVNGPSMTVIKGALTTNGNAAVRCVYAVSGSVLDGFSLTNGRTRASYQSLLTESDGGGISCESLGVVVSNCVLTGNEAFYYGGGACGGTLKNCTLVGNKALCGGGGVYAAMENCLLLNNIVSEGGGAFICQLDHCRLMGNRAKTSAGGAGESSLRNCLVVSNSAGYAGGTGGSDLENCTVTGNSGTNTVMNVRGGVARGTLRNSIVYANYAVSNANFYDASLTFCCTTPMPTNGTGNITNEPQFVNAAAGDCRLQPSSPCIDRGVNERWMDGATDLEDNRRIINGAVDMGCYETPYYLTLRVWLQGPYDTNSHRMTTNLMSVLPLTAPYASDHRTAASVPSNVMDWALLQLRAGATGKTVVSRSVFLKRGGYLAADTGTNVISLDISASNYYVIVQHRNHLPAMSAAAVSFTNNFVTYDFTTNWSQFYGGTNGCVRIDSNMWGMIAGDADGDGKITAIDQAICSAQTNETGYKAGDFNLDGVVNE